MRSLLAIVVVIGAVVLPSAPATSQELEESSTRALVFYTAPMLTEVVDPFRPPAHVGAPGNRGLEYGDSDQQVVAAAASGYVLFAGPVAGRDAITIQHDDGVRTTYTGLLEIWVTEGMTVSQHSAIAIAGSGFHFGARINDHYLDPQILIDASQAEMRPRLLPPPAGWSLGG